MSEHGNRHLVLVQPYPPPRTRKGAVSDRPDAQAKSFACVVDALVPKVNDSPLYLSLCHPISTHRCSLHIFVITTGLGESPEQSAKLSWISYATRQDGREDGGQDRSHLALTWIEVGLLYYMRV